MPTTTGMVSSFSAIRSRGLLQEMREETRMEMMSTRKGMLEIAIAAMKAVIPEDKEADNW